MPVYYSRGYLPKLPRPPIVYSQKRYKLDDAILIWPQALKAVVPKL